MKFEKIGVGVILVLLAIIVVVLVIRKPDKVQMSRAPVSTGVDMVDGVKVSQTDDSLGTVEKWESDSGNLTVKADDGHEFVVHLDGSNQEIVMIGDVGKNTLERNIVTAKSTLWETAFCPYDKVTAVYDGQGKVKLIQNLGYRTCGFKGE